MTGADVQRWYTELEARGLDHGPLYVAISPNIPREEIALMLTRLEEIQGSPIELVTLPKITPISELPSFFQPLTLCECGQGPGPRCAATLGCERFGCGCSGTWCEHGRVAEFPL